ncbi:cytochrome C oxidase subunit III [Campylobacter blaseri]|uniref:cytochrome C oxidase subunit III n=1 Tax=Campylobacter blaseri TaxID=2042961 RepID=UPI003B97EF94
MSLSFCDSFITDMEYGQMLYQNPRGIGCNKCHGKKGEGSVIAKYKEHNRSSQELYDKELVAPPINRLSLQDFAKGIKISKDIMPLYFLTNDEIIILYKYIKEINKEKK